MIKNQLSSTDELVCPHCGKKIDIEAIVNIFSNSKKK